MTTCSGPLLRLLRQIWPQSAAALLQPSQSALLPGRQNSFKIIHAKNWPKRYHVRGKPSESQKFELLSQVFPAKGCEQWPSNPDPGSHRGEDWRARHQADQGPRHVWQDGHWWRHPWTRRPNQLRKPQLQRGSQGLIFISIAWKEPLNETWLKLGENGEHGKGMRKVRCNWGSWKDATDCHPLRGVQSGQPHLHHVLLHHILRHLHIWSGSKLFIFIKCVCQVVSACYSFTPLRQAWSICINHSPIVDLLFPQANYCTTAGYTGALSALAVCGAWSAWKTFKNRNEESQHNKSILSNSWVS